MQRQREGETNVYERGGKKIIKIMYTRFFQTDTHKHTRKHTPANTQNTHTNATFNPLPPKKRDKSKIEKRK